MAAPERAGVVLHHTDHPIPSRRHLLASTVPAVIALVLAGLITTWWAGRSESGPHWFSLAWIPIMGIAWLILTTTRAPRPVLAYTGHGADIAAARHKALRAHQLPSSPSMRIGAAVRSCSQLENMALLAAAGATTVVGAMLRPGLPWLPVLTTLGVLTATALLGTGRAWAYLRLHERRFHPPRLLNPAQGPGTPSAGPHRAHPAPFRVLLKSR